MSDPLLNDLHHGMHLGGSLATYLHVGTNVMIGLSYYTIPLGIYHYLRKRPDLEYRWIAHLFVAFIGLCGTGHLLAAAQPWIDAVTTPMYAVHLLTAAVSMLTAVLLWVIMPQLLRIPTSAMLRRSIDATKAEVRRRIDAEQALRESQIGLERRVAERTRQLAEKEERLRLATEVAYLGTWDHGPSPQWSNRAKEIFGRPADWQPSVPEIWRAIHPEDRKAVREALHGASDALLRVPLNIEFRVIHPDGSIHWVAVQGKALFETERGRTRPVRLVGVMKDISEKKQWLTRLQQSEARFREMTNAMPQIVWTNDGHANITYLNDRWREMTGTSGLTYAERRPFYHPDDAVAIRAAWNQALAERQPFEHESRWFDTRHNDYRWHLLRAVPVEHDDGDVVWYGTSTDIHEQKRNEVALAASVAEKETLLREVHHRVKNNLQSLWALLQLEKAAISDDNARNRLEAVSNRISIMGNIHRQLYKSSNLAMIDFGSQLQELTRNIVQLTRGNITCEMDARSLYCDLDVAIPLGLIANEIVTNTVKHAFPDNRAGTVRVSFRRDGDAVRLVVADNGIGMPDEPSSGVGEMLITALAEQIEAELETRVDGGTTITLTLPGGKFSDSPEDGVKREAA